MTYLPGSVYTFQTVTSTPTPLSVGNRTAYVCKGSGILTFKLPVTTLAGFSFKIIGQNCLWQIMQNAMQQIGFGPFNTTMGISGSLSSTAIDDQIEVTCLTQNTNWIVTECFGNITLI